MKHIIFGALLSISLLSCGQENTTTNENVATTENGTQRYERVDKGTFLTFVQDHNDVQIVDVRTPGEFGNGFIPGAVNIDFNNANFKSEIEKLDKTKPVLIYCQAGGRSAKALSMMSKMNFTTVLELEGGYGNYISPNN